MGTQGLEVTKSDPIRALVSGLEFLGWSIQNAEIDLTRETVRIEIKRADGLLLTLDARNGKASATRERTYREAVSVGRRGDRCRVERCRTEFLGRTQLLGARHGLRWLSSYIADNATRPALAEDVRALFSPIMDGQRRLLSPAPAVGGAR